MCHVSHVRVLCHMSCVTCQISGVTCHKKIYINVYISLKKIIQQIIQKKYKVGNLVGGGSVINGDTLSSLLKNVIVEQPGLQWVC